MINKGKYSIIKAHILKEREGISMKKRTKEKVQHRISAFILCFLVASCMVMTGCSNKETEQDTEDMGTQTQQEEQTQEKTSQEEMDEKETDEIEKIDETENIKDTSVVEKFDEGRIGFYSNGYWGMEIKSIDNQSKTITYDGYESTDGGPACVDRQGTIVDSDTLDIQGVILKWEGDTFVIEKEEDLFILGDMPDGTRGHDVEHGTGRYSKIERIQETVDVDSGGVPKDIELYEGEYYDSRIFGNDLSCPKNPCRVVIYNVAVSSFDFRIEQRNEETEEYEVVFKDHSAQFIEDGTTAVYRGEKYTLNFSFPNITSIKIDGFDMVDDVLFYNNSIPGHESS